MEKITIDPNFTWNRWSERKPEEGQPIIVVVRDIEIGKRATRIIHFGNALISLIECNPKSVLDNTYWIEFPE